MKITRIALDHQSEKHRHDQVMHVLNKVIETVPDDNKGIMLFPGGFIEEPVPLPHEFFEDISSTEVFKASETYELHTEMGIEMILIYLEELGQKREELFKKAEYLSLGVDLTHPDNTITELVFVIDTNTTNVLCSGKFYPTTGEQDLLIKDPNLKSHFVQLGSTAVMILGCHDLNVYNPRGWATAAEGGYKKTVQKKFMALAKEHAPEIVLQHPHETDSSSIWRNGWSSLKKELPSVKHFASGIYYDPHNAREPLEKVLDATKYGNVNDLIIEI